MKFKLSLVLVLLFSSNIFAQTGKDTPYWKWSEYGEHHNSLVEVKSKLGSGCGVVIFVDKTKPLKGGFQGHVLTAWHLFESKVLDENHNVTTVTEKKDIKIKYTTGKMAKNCSVIGYTKGTDLDIAIVHVWVPEGIEAVKISESEILFGDNLEYLGLGGDSSVTCCSRHFLSFASSPTNPKNIFSNTPLLPGDSGGPIFNDKHELVGVISGGWFWWGEGIVNDKGAIYKPTWPAKANNIGPIRKLIKDLKENNLN